MIDRRPLGLIARVLVLCCLSCAASDAYELPAAEAPNAYCPVMPEMEGSSDITLLYKGHEVRFCCTGCRREFLADPEKYLANLPNIEGMSFIEKAGEFLGKSTDLLLMGACVLGLLWLRYSRKRWMAEQATEPSFVTLFCTKTVSPTVPLLCLLLFAAYEINALDSTLFFKMHEEDIHFATFNDYGTPPVPSPPKHERRLAGTYYRGNDERSPLLINGGNYRTATFHIALVDSQDQPLVYGQQLAAGPVYVRFQIDRTQFTPDFLYSDRFMKAIFLTRESSPSLGRDNPVADRVPLNEVEEMWQWEARYAITPSGMTLDAMPAGGAEWEGIVYVCEDKFYQPHRFAEKNTVVGARFHYGIPYRLVLRDGKVAAESELSMGSLYRTRKFPIHKLPLDQWFSEKPIPELTEPNTEDPTLLGIEDYLSP